MFPYLPCITRVERQQEDNRNLTYPYISFFAGCLFKMLCRYSKFLLTNSQNIFISFFQYLNISRKTIKILFWRIPKIRSTTYLSLSTSILISTRPWGDCRCHTFGILRWMLRLLGFWEILPWRFLREGTHRNKWWDNDWYDWFTGHRDFMGYDMMVINRDLANKNGDIECVCPVVLISSVCELENHHIFTW